MLDKLAWLKDKLNQPAFAHLRRLEHEVSAYRWLAMTQGRSLLMLT